MKVDGINDAITNNDGADPPKARTEVAVAEHDTLKYHLLGPSLTKAGQDAVDQQKVSKALRGTKPIANSIS